MRTIIVFFFVFTATLSSQTIELDLIIDEKNSVYENFQGFGAEWDSRHYNLNKVTDEDFKIISKRIDWMKTSFVRIMMLAKWCFVSDGKYDWENEDMAALYRHLDYCQSRGVTVLLTEWGIERDWVQIAGINYVDDNRFLDIIADYLDYFINVKGYTCIKYISLVNEPNYEVMDFPRWSEGIKKLHNKLIEKRLYGKVQIVGPGQSWDDNWFYNSVNSLRDYLDHYTIHRYEFQEKVYNGDLKSYLDGMISYVKENDPNFDEKYFFITEAGMADGLSTEKHPWIDSVSYGNFMASYASLALNAGVDAVLAWMMDDNSHEDFEFGLWKDKKNGMKTRPYFYVWSLLSRYIPKGADIYRTFPKFAKLYTIAARVGDKKNSYWTYCLINNSERKVKVNLTNILDEDGTFKKFVYNKNERKVNTDQFPLPLSEVKSKNNKLEVEIAPKSVYFFTSIPY